MAYRPAGRRAIHGAENLRQRSEGWKRIGRARAGARLARTLRSTAVVLLSWRPVACAGTSRCLDTVFRCTTAAMRARWLFAAARRRSQYPQRRAAADVSMPDLSSDSRMSTVERTRRYATPILIGAVARLTVPAIPIAGCWERRACLVGGSSTCRYFFDTRGLPASILRSAAVVDVVR
jgi:hypothetical protein